MAEQADTDVNYMRNSVKATVDAYDGTVTLYAFGQDPIRDAWNKAFGGKLIKPESAIPADLCAHFRYPEDQLKVQRDLLTRFHVTDAKTFYSRAELLAGAGRPGATRTGPQAAAVLSAGPVPGPDHADVPAGLRDDLPGNQPNLSALISGSYVDGKPQLSVYDDPERRQTVLGPTQVQQKMQNDPNVRKDLSLFQSVEFDGRLWQPAVVAARATACSTSNRSTSSRRRQNSYPLMKKVLLNYGDYVAYDNDIASGIKDLLAQAKAGAPTTTVPPTDDESPTGTARPVRRRR